MKVGFFWKDYTLHDTVKDEDRALWYVVQLAEDYAADRRKLTAYVMSVWSAPGECDPDAETELDIVIWHDFRKIRLIDNVRKSDKVIKLSSLTSGGELVSTDSQTERKHAGVGRGSVKIG